ncbi:tRNA (adenosine(37)-N6)-dimethylallyltransferase MiaA [Solibacillus daqui]|uniref:tRNA (adenosine(37)-N6)-dimethylallyltransferase MiaA n=1 Tax=Solibacillus daqui TaxID=2912187 RepID=UPI002366FABD|nr:tRNA (adenosine(37)-N6)-dimethylallyltransferase MiaA [Solibacillus daqui]
MNKKIDVVAIIGPTASGKTALSIRLAKEFDGEIINGDSMQIYRHMNIGTAKITPEEMDGVPHHLLDIKEPTESFSVAEYQLLVREKIEEIQSRGKMPILVGGTGLYVQSVLYDFQFAKQEVNEEAREAYYKELELLGPEEMHEKLTQIDPAAAAEIHPNNTRRVIRALEMAELAGVSRAAEQFNRGDVALYNHLIIGMDMDREKLYERINLRVDLMMDAGLLDEVRALYDAGIRDVQAIKAIGYKEFYAYFDGNVTLEEAIEQVKQNSRRYAKRQLTYFRNKMEIKWIGKDYNEIKKIL